MTNFYLSALGIVLLAALFVVYPIMLQRMREKSKHKQKQVVMLSNANVVKQRMLELEREVEEGLIDADDKDNAVHDLKLALVDETPDFIESKKNVSVVMFIALGIPALLIGAWVYWQSNQLEGLQAYTDTKIEIDDLRKKLEEQGPESLTPDDFAKFALSIRTALRDDPSDVRGWTYLAMVSTSIGRVDEGIAAYKKALDLTPLDDNLRFKFAETLMLQGTQDSLDNAKRQLEYLIQKQPNARNNRLLMTSVAIQLQDAELATAQFSVIKNDMNPTSQFYQSIVAELKKLGVSDVAIVGEPNMGQVDVAQTNVSSIEALPPSTSVQGSEVSVTVNISDELGSKLPSNAYLIVFAQHNDGRSRAPLAVKRFALPQLPVQISLSDSDAMIPAMNLSSAERIKITARISLDDDVMPAAGELEGSVVNIDLSNMPNNVINVVINKVL